MLDKFVNSRYSVFSGDEELASGLTAVEMLKFVEKSLDTIESVFVTVDGTHKDAYEITRELEELNKSVRQD